MIIKKYISTLLYSERASERDYIEYLKAKKVILGEHVKIWGFRSVYIDDTKPYLIKIGDYVKITKGVTILAHDYSHSVLRRQFGEFRGGTLPVTIGDNVFIGNDSIILMGTTVGNNSIIGAHSVVKGCFPDNSVIAGNPAKVLFTTSQMYEKTTENWIKDAIITARAIYKNKGGIPPTIEEMSDAYVWLYLPRKEENVEKYRRFFDLTCDDYKEIKETFLRSIPVFDDFNHFLEACQFNSDDN